MVQENAPGASMHILLKGNSEVYCQSRHRERLATRRLKERSGGAGRWSACPPERVGQTLGNPGLIRPEAADQLPAK